VEELETKRIHNLEKAKRKRSIRALAKQLKKQKTQKFCHGGDLPTTPLPSTLKTKVINKHIASPEPTSYLLVFVCQQISGLISRKY
jgi:hypothetical protein